MTRQKSGSASRVSDLRRNFKTRVVSLSIQRFLSVTSCEFLFCGLGLRCVDEPRGRGRGTHTRPRPRAAPVTTATFPSSFPWPFPPCLVTEFSGIPSYPLHKAAADSG